MECIQKIMGACEATGDSAHFDLVKAKEKQQNDSDGMFFIGNQLVYRAFPLLICIMCSINITYE